MTKLARFEVPDEIHALAHFVAARQGTTVPMVYQAVVIAFMENANAEDLGAMVFAYADAQIRAKFEDHPRNPAREE